VSHHKEEDNVKEKFLVTSAPLVVNNTANQDTRWVDDPGSILEVDDIPDDDTYSSDDDWSDHVPEQDAYFAEVNLENTTTSSEQAVTLKELR
jgi:hypothetical protein